MFMERCCIIQLDASACREVYMPVPPRMLTLTGFAVLHTPSLPHVTYTFAKLASPLQWSNIEVEIPATIVHPNLAGKRCLQFCLLMHALSATSSVLTEVHHAAGQLSGGHGQLL